MSRFLFALPLMLSGSLALAAPGEPVVPAPAVRPPVVDGRLDEAAWKQAPRLGNFTGLGSGETAEPGTTFRILADDKFLYFAAEMEEPATASLVADRTHPDDAHLHEDDCVELYLAVGKQRTNYYQFVINSRGVLGDREWVQGGVVSNIQWNSGARVATTVEKGKWTVEMAIPWAALDMKEASTGDWGLNVARERRAGGTLDLSSFVPMTGSFQQPALFAPLRVEAAPLERYAWEIGAPSEVSVFKQDGQLQMKARIFVKNLSGKLRAIALRARLGAEPVSEDEPEIGDNLDAGQSKVYHVVLPVRESGPQLLTVDIVPRAEPSEAYSSRTFAVNLSYEPIAITLTNPAYRDIIFASENFRELRGIVTSSLPEDDLGAAQLHLQVSPADHPDVRLAEETLKGLTVTTEFALPLPDLADGDFVLQAALLDREGREIGRSSRAFRKVPPPMEGHEWRIDASGVLRKDGHRFFPIGWFSIPPEDVKAANGLYTAILSYVGPDMSVREIRKYLNGIQEAGAYAMISPYPATAIMERGPEPLSEDDAAAIRKRVEQFKDHPALMGWYIGDEPEYHRVLPSRLRAVTDLIASIDPYHPTMLINNSNAGLEAFAKSVDILNPDPYPFFKRGGHSLTPLGKVANMVETACRLSSPRNSAWATLQTYNTEDFGGKGERFPDFREMRNTAWQSFAAGAHGLLFWAFEWARNYPDLMIGVPFLTAEIKQLEPWIFAPEAGGIEVAETDRENLVFSRRVAEEAQLIIAVSLADQDREFVLRVPELAGRTLDVLGESRRVAVDAEGNVRDEFPAFGTHLYALGMDAGRFPELSGIQGKINAANAARRKPGNLAFEESGIDVTASSTGLYRPGPKRVVDGVRDGMAWQSVDSSQSNWLLLSWPEAVQAGRAVLFSDVVTEFEVQIPDGRGENGAPAWKTIGRGEGSGTDPIEVAFPAVRTDQLRFLMTKRKPGAAADRVWEIEIYEK